MAFKALTLFIVALKLTKKCQKNGMYILVRVCYCDVYVNLCGIF